MLSGAQRKEILNTLRDFRLSGIGLPTEAQQRYGEIQARLSELASRFSNNVLDATQGWSKLVTDEAELAGLPASAQAAARQLAELKGQGGLAVHPGYSLLPAGDDVCRQPCIARRTV